MNSKRCSALHLTDLRKASRVPQMPRRRAKLTMSARPEGVAGIRIVAGADGPPASVTALTRKGRAAEALGRSLEGTFCGTSTL